MDDLRRDLTPLLEQFPREQRWLLPAYERVQQELGWLPLWAIETVGAHLRVPKSEAYGVATHFPELRLERPGRCLVRVCTGLSCRVQGGDAVLAALQRELDLRPGQTSADGATSLEELPCAFICSVGPVIEVEHEAHGGLTAESAVALVRARLASEGSR